ncbi:abdominal ganglion neuropeptides L5-67-like isoform X1 [Haliotis cracherodii]|uniref:abdominal ganglion neuropeptides L5-67-like isoform X1 n=2 Tax=Haliotis rufescens TaxID=6454 RepID=UPI001EB0448C|nr:abdominal ganglion neuropeptides L5-67-like isoform X1 [Haliotis rufescens]
MWKIMKLAEIVLCITTVLLLTFTTGNGAPQWRPQGRFGKRVQNNLPLLINEDSSNHSPEPASSPYEIPIEKLETHSDGSVLRLLDRLCTESNVPGFRKCLWNKRK